MLTRAVLLTALLLLPSGAGAGEIVVLAVDQHGRPVEDAVIELFGPGSAPLPEPAVSAARAVVIDQKNIRFDPAVTVVRQGAQVRFRNSDPTIHHVYSFSPLKRFELLVDPGQSSEPIAYDKPGAAAIGCNIHDKMAAHLYIARSPFATTTGADGTAVFHNMAPRTYEILAWHSRLRDRNERPVTTVAVMDLQERIEIELTLRPQARSGVRRGRY